MHLGLLHLYLAQQCPARRGSRCGRVAQEGAHAFGSQGAAVGRGYPLAAAARHVERVYVSRRAVVWPPDARSGA